MRSLLLIMISFLGACSGQYMGLEPDRLDPEIANLVGHAQSGDKYAQYILGLHFALGRHVPQDCVKARKLLRQAARPSGGPLWVYAPPVNKGGAGRVIPVDRGTYKPGLPAARNVLAAIDSCQEENDIGRQ